MDMQATSGTRAAWILAAIVCIAALPAAADKPVQQVLIEARIAEMSSSVLYDLGVDWSLSGAGAPNAFSLGSTLSPAQVDRALQNIDDVRILANPRVTTITGETARIQVGGEIPFAQPNDSAAMSFQDFGIDMGFVPVVGSDGTIRLEIQTQVSDVVAPDGAQPEIEQRNVRTTVELRDGQTIALGGIYREDARSWFGQVPILGDVPILGRLFRSDAFQSGDSQFVILLSPSLVGGGDSARPVRIETRVVDVNRTAGQQLGIDFDGLGAGFQTESIDTDALIRSLNQSSDASLLANPEITTLSGNPATIQVGGEVPVQRGSGTAVEYDDFGVTLDFTPTVVPGTGNIRLEIQPTVSEFDTTVVFPQITTRTLDTNVELRDGQTVVLGGLFQQDGTAAQSQVPQLSNLPMLGRWFQSQDGAASERALLIFLTPVLLGGNGEVVSGGGAPVAVSGPKFAVSGTGGYFRQDLPSGNGGLGVVGVGADEKPFLNLPTVVNAGGGGLEMAVPIRGLGQDPVRVLLNGWYASGDADFDDEVEAQPGVTNGITYWNPTNDMMAFTGISQIGAGLEGQGTFDFDTARLRTGFEIDLTRPLDPLLDRMCDSPAQDFSPGAPWSARPRFFFQAQAGFDYRKQKSTSHVQLVYEDIGIDSWDVQTRNEIDLEEWHPEALFRLDYSQPIPGVRGLTFIGGGGFGLGYRSTSADANQHNWCDVRFSVSPGTNACSPNTQDFRISENVDEDGFDWSISTGARFEYDFKPFEKTTVKASVGYEFDYLGVSRFNAPTNLDVDGSPNIDHEQEALHRVGVSLQLAF